MFAEQPPKTTEEVRPVVADKEIPADQIITMDASHLFGEEGGGESNDGTKRVQQGVRAEYNSKDIDLNGNVKKLVLNLDAAGSEFITALNKASGKQIEGVQLVTDANFTYFADIVLVGGQVIATNLNNGKGIPEGKTDNIRSAIAVISNSELNN